MGKTVLKIPVFLSSDDCYSPFVATTMASILKCTKEFIEFYILDCGISDANVKKIKNTKKHFDNFSVEFIKIDTEKDFKDFPSLPYISKAMYGRYLISELKPDIGRAIYSDIDVAFTGDIKTLWEENLENYPVGAVPSQRGSMNNDYYELKQKLNLDKEHDFFMSGLLIIDCKQWRKEGFSSKLFETTLKFKDNVDLPDQEVFNVVFNNNYKRLDPKYCVIYKIFNEYYTKEKIHCLKNNQIIVHYPGTLDSKPWNNPNLESANYFWDIVKYTDFVKDIKNMLKEYRKKNFNIKNIIKSIFSIQNSERHKIITILGIKIKLSRFKKISQKKKKKLYKKFNKHLKKMHKISNYLKPENREECFDRKFINDYVQSNKNYIKGDVLEFSGGDIIYAKKYGDKNINLKMAAYQGHKDIYPHADYHIDLEDISTLPEQKFDCIVATQVIMYMYDLKKTMENLKYMLKDNGALILTVPGPISYHSKGTRHMFSFTEESMTRLCSEIFGKENLLNVVPYGNLEYVQYCLYWMVPPENERHLEHENRYTLLIGCLCQNNKKN